ncbi:Nucleoside 5-triphosphatase RdgB (dHAPTP dITP XTP-specific) [Patulibacter medicamentivorans]|uniref:dITP/XTP pyrophosphatase n=1 Tax=Patulibacter medicamentivorans TaxID=1097667 RepID=H0E0H3_9ACTN|nr:non-canonical purine NTP pyrophosphatase [Patulibacter medicamentivorans]EHN12834.1 Nucleoside 5-triphosphatase RdgB (dHAPTP dITP XTP-specific) [Patulibacter medicamentivorans]
MTAPHRSSAQPSADRSLLLATRNAHKAEEFAVLLAPWTVDPLPEDVRLPPETGSTFAENALGKARAAAAASGRLAFGDDSGIQAAALDGAPGVRSARFAGETATDAENLEKLRAAVPPGGQLAYVCAIAIVDPSDGAEHVVEGRCGGRMADAPRGSGGFGYDPIFVADDDPAGRTMAQLRPEEKAAISHRGRAVSLLRAWLAERPDPQS